MFSGKRVFRLFLAMILAAGFVSPVFADSDSDSDSDSDFRGAKVVGSWEALSTLDTGEQAPGLFTFNRDRTWMSSGDNAFFSNGHGAWKKAGPRRFTATNKAFVLAETGGVSLVFTNRTELEVARNAQSFTATFETEVSLPDGTVVDTVTGTATGVRITVD